MTALERVTQGIWTDGNDLEAVKIPMTGFAAIGEKDGPQLAYTDLQAFTTLPAGYSYLGLFTVDGGPQEGNEADEAAGFFQQGYRQAAGSETHSVTLTLAEDNPTVRRLFYDEQPGPVFVRKAALPQGVFPLLLVTRYRNGTELRRAGRVRVTSLEPGQETRSEIKSVAVTFTFEFQPDLPNPVQGGAPGGYEYAVHMVPGGGPEPLYPTPPVKTMAPLASARVAVNAEQAQIPFADLDIVVSPDGAVTFEPDEADPNFGWMTAAETASGTVTVFFEYEPEDGSGRRFAGQMDVTVDATLPPLYFNDGKTPANVEAWSSSPWSSFVFYGDPEETMQVRGGNPRITVEDETLIEASYVDTAGMRLRIEGLKVGQTSVIVSWDQGEDDPAYAVELPVNVTPPAFVVRADRTNIQLHGTGSSGVTTIEPRLGANTLLPELYGDCVFTGASVEGIVDVTPRLVSGSRQYRVTPVAEGTVTLSFQWPAEPDPDNPTQTASVTLNVTPTPLTSLKTNVRVPVGLTPTSISWPLTFGYLACDATCDVRIDSITPAGVIGEGGATVNSEGQVTLSSDVGTWGQGEVTLTVSALEPGARNRATVDVQVLVATGDMFVAAGGDIGSTTLSLSGTSSKQMEFGYPRPDDPGRYMPVDIGSDDTVFDWFGDSARVDTGEQPDQKLLVAVSGGRAELTVYAPSLTDDSWHAGRLSVFVEP